MSPEFPKAAPVFMLVELPPTADAARRAVELTTHQAGGRARRVDQHALLVQLLVRATPAMRELAAQVFNDPNNPKWEEEYSTS